MLPKLTVEHSLSRVAGSANLHIRIKQIDDLSPGIGSSRVFRIWSDPAQHHDGTVQTSYILKIPDWGGSTLIQNKDPFVDVRERLFVESGLPALLPSGMRTPRLYVSTRSTIGHGCGSRTLPHVWQRLGMLRWRVSRYAGTLHCMRSTCARNPVCIRSPGYNGTALLCIVTMFRRRMRILTPCHAIQYGQLC